MLDQHIDSTLEQQASSSSVLNGKRQAAGMASEHPYSSAEPVLAHGKQ